MELAFKSLGRRLDTLQSTLAGQGSRKGFGVRVLEEIQESEAEVGGRVSAVEGTTGKAWRPEAPSQMAMWQQGLAREHAEPLEEPHCTVKVLGRHGRGLSRRGPWSYLGVRKFPPGSPW